MKTRTLYMIAMAVLLALSPLLATGFAASNVYADEKAGETGSVFAATDATNAPNIYIEKTCSGDRASTRPKVFMYGLRDDSGKCMTKNFMANSEDEAYECAKKLCPDCSVEDITWMFGFSSSAPGISNAGNYCPSRR